VTGDLIMQDNNLGDEYINKQNLYTHDDDDDDVSLV
jgi:hypothetical protein